MWRILVCALIAFGLPGVQLAASAATYTVTNTLDSGVNSLRWAINQANLNTGADVVQFNIPATDPGCAAGVCTIHLLTPLIVTADNAGVTIDGYTQPDADYASSTQPAQLKIELDGSSMPNNVASIAIGITSSNNIVRGLVINRFPSYGILIGQATVTDRPYTNTISGNFIGTDISGTLDLGNGSGVGLATGAALNTIGGDIPAERNIISGNTYDGALLYGATVSFNLFSGNYIGLNAAGTGALPNGRNGVWLDGGANNNFIGWLNMPPGWRNVISGNGVDNVHITGTQTVQNAVVGNFIGTNAAGDAALGGTNGVYVGNGAFPTYIGGATSGQGNLISGNSQNGIYMSADVSGVVVRGNWVGLNSSGNAAVPNGVNGIHASGGVMYIGEPGVYSRNIISGNAHNGIYFTGETAAYHRLQNNYIGTNPAGNAAIPNEWSGVLVMGGANHITIGGDNAGEGNLISGNTQDGVRISGAGTDANQVIGNLIGLDVTGSQALGNQGFGVQVNSMAQNNLIGGDDLISDGSPGSFSRNIISGNSDGGVLIYGASHNQVTGNYIGTDISGLVGFLEGGLGVEIQAAATYNMVGSCDEFQGNIISGNPGHGVGIDTAGADYNTLACNRIGLTAVGDGLLGNGGYGVSIGNDASHNRVGQYNQIAGNGFDGLRIYGADSDDNEITQSGIYANGEQGISLTMDANNNIPAPVIVSAVLGGAPGDDDTVSGTACAFCRVEVFASGAPDGEGQEYLGSVSAAAGGAFTLSAISLPEQRPFLTATAYIAGDGTSQFSAVFNAPFDFIYLPLVSR